MNEQRISQVALTSIPKIGSVTAKKLIAHCGGAEEVFREKKSILEKIPGIRTATTKLLHQHRKEAFLRAEEELNFIQQKGIELVFLLDDNYPSRLLHCVDGPILLYKKGNMNLNKRKIVSIVGTRLSTDYGVEVCKQLVKDLVPHDPLIVSGMAYGIDIVAHRAAIENGLQTVGVMAHGLNEVYPSRHQGTALQMMENGGLLSEFKCGTPSMPENFPKRNRIVAGVADLTIVIESSDRGGSLITADLANQYNRDLFAVPGNLHSTQSEGCNWLIKTNKAALLQSVKDIEYVMGWEPKEPKPNKMLQVQGKEEKRIVKTLLTQEKMGIDTIAQRSNIPLSKTSATLLTLELEGVVKAYPGKLYKLL